MVLDHQGHYVLRVRSVLAGLVLPLQYVVNYPMNKLKTVSEQWQFRHQLQTENDKLRIQQLLLRAKLQKVLGLEQENLALKALLSSTKTLDDKVIVAQLLAVNSAEFAQQVIINKGKRQGIYLGQPALDAYGVIGQVILVNSNSSRVQLLTDRHSAIPIFDLRSKIRGIAIGQGENQSLALIHMPNTADIKVGDKLLTSGLGQQFPYGYPVGIVSKILHQRDQRFMQVWIAPIAHFQRSRQLLMVFRSQS